MRWSARFAAAAVAAAAAAAAVLALFGVFRSEDEQGPPSGALARGDRSTAGDVDRVRGGVVLVSALAGGRTAAGSGFMFDPSGLIVTNGHLVGHPSVVRVHAEGVSGAVPATVLGTDPATDTALLKVPADDARHIQALPLGESRTLRVGEPVVAVGPPFALDSTVTAGIVSALEHEFEAPNGRVIDGAIETDAAIGPGNSGGPLIDSGGRVVGINTETRAAAGGGAPRLGFAVPVDTLKEVVGAIRDRGSLRAPYLGVVTAPLSPGLAEVLALQVEHGLLVRSVAPGSPAARAGIRAFNLFHGTTDVITAVDGDAVREPRDLAQALIDRKPGDRVTIELVRGNRQLTRVLRLARPPGP